MIQWHVNTYCKTAQSLKYCNCLCIISKQVELQMFVFYNTSLAKLASLSSHYCLSLPPGVQAISERAECPAYKLLGLKDYRNGFAYITL